MKRLLAFLMGGFLLFAVAAVPSAYAKHSNRYLSSSAQIKMKVGAHFGVKTAKAENEERDDRDDVREEEEESAPRLRSLVAFIASVDTQTKTVYIRKNSSQKVMANGALVVLVSADGAKVGSLSDLKVGAKARFLVKKERLARDFFQAVLIIQGSEKEVKPPPPPPEAPAVEFDDRSDSGDESRTSVSIPVMLSKTSDKDVKVKYAVSGGSATGGGVDYSLPDGELTIPAGQKTANIALTVMDDSLDESHEWLSVKLSNPSNARLGDRSEFFYTIFDNDPAQPPPPPAELPMLEFNDASGSGDESQSAVSLPLSLSKTSDKDVKVKYAVSGGTATAGSDYSLASGELTIPAGQKTANIALTVHEDSADEPDETVKVKLSSPSNAKLGEKSEFTYTIKDNDPTPPPPPVELPTVQFSTSADSGDEARASVNIGLNLSKAFDKEVSVHYSVSGTASGSGMDYTLASGDVKFAAGQTSANLVLKVEDDTVDELDETVVLKLSSPVNATLGEKSEFTYTIKDNDQTSVGFTSISSFGVEDETSVSIPVKLSMASPHEVTVKYAVAGGTAIGGGVDFTLQSGEIKFAPGQTTGYIVLSVTDDMKDEPDENVLIVLSNSVNATLGTKLHSYWILDND